MQKRGRKETIYWPITVDDTNDDKKRSIFLVLRKDNNTVVFV